MTQANNDYFNPILLGIFTYVSSLQKVNEWITFMAGLVTIFAGLYQITRWIKNDFFTKPKE